MTEEDNILEIKHLTKRFPGVTALDDVSLNIRRGETHVLLGENGAGKSSLIKVISGIYSAEEGEIDYNGLAYSPVRPHDAIEAGIQVIDRAWRHIKEYLGRFGARSGSDALRVKINTNKNTT